MAENLQPLIQMYFGLVTNPSLNAIPLLLITKAVLKDASDNYEDMEAVERWNDAISEIEATTDGKLGIRYSMAAYILNKYLNRFGKGAGAVNSLNNVVVVGKRRLTIADIYESVINAVSKMTEIIIEVSQAMNVEWNFTPKGIEDYIQYSDG